MVRRGLVAVLASLAVVLGLLQAAPSPAEAAKPLHPWGRATSKDHVLRAGCHRYPINYRVNAPTNEWAAEIFVINPNGRRLAHWAVDKGANPAKGRVVLDICRPSTVYGKHRLEMKVTWQRGRQTYDGWVKPSRFRFTKPRR